MNSSRLCLLLLLLSGCAAAQSHGGSREQTPMCMLESRYRVNWKYVYHYSTESHNSVVGTTGLRNGPKVSCQVQIEVPHTCSFIMHTRDCTLSEASAVDPQGQPVYRHALGSDTFRTRMERSPLKITMEGPGHVQLYPDSDEPVDILNIKRGIVSALMEGEASSTLHGQCLTQYEVNSRQDAPTGLTFSRDLSQCDHFYSRRLTNSPMALLQNLHHPISKLIKSTQSCSYQFDNKGSHITTATCTETHTYLPFFHRENGMSSVVTQELIFQSMKRISSKPFGVDPNQARPLHFEDLHHKSPVQTTDAVLSSMQELVDLAGKGQGQRRASLFQTLVSSMRGLRNETLSQAASDMVKISSWLTFQALFQCGTSECTSAIMQIIWTIDGVSLEVDALVYGLSLQPDPDRARVKDMLSMAQYKQSKAIMYALANTVKKFYKGEVTPEITEVSTFMEQLLNDCSKEIPDTASDFSPDPKEMSFLVLRVVGVMAQAMQDSSPSLVSSVLRCSQKTDLPLANQKAALRTLQQMDMNDEIRSTLMELYRDTQSPLEKRIAAYLVLMKKPDRSLLRDLVNSLMKERDKQLRSFVVSYLNNILRSEDPQMLQIKADIEKVLQGELPPQNNVFHGLSRNYKMESPLGSVHSNIIFDGRNTLPKEVILEATMKAFGSSYDIFEVGVEGAGFEPTVDALFGEKGFFSESISRLMRFLGDKTPLLKEVLDRISPHQERMKRQVTEDHLKAFKGIFQKLLQDVRLSEAPEATAYLRLLGEEIGYLKTSEMRNILEGFSLYYHIFIRVLPAQAFLKLTSSTENELFFHYIFMENAFSLPTASGFPLTFSLSGVLAPGVQGGLIPSAMTSLSVMPSVGLEFITHMGVDIPDYVDAGIQMHTNMYHESSLNAKISISRNQVRVWIPAPTSNTQVFSISNQLLSISSGQTKVVPSLLEDRVDSTDCHPFLRGLNICTIVRYSNGSSDNQAPYYPLNGDMRFAVEIQPTGKVSEYSATFTDETLREGKRGRHKVESLKLTLKAEGTREEPMEATASLKYNHNKNLILTELRIPDYDVEAVTKLAVTDSESGENKLRGITIDITNKNIPQLTFVGRARFDTLKEALVQIHVDIPPLKSNGSVLAFLNKDESVLLDVETVALLAGTSYQQKTSLRYDEDKFEVELKTHLNSEIEKVVPNAKEHHKLLQQYVDDLLDQRVAKTDMKLRHIITKGIEAGNIWLDKLTARFPSLASLRSKRSISDLTLPALPEKLFWEVDSLFRYQFNKDTKFISFHLPFGGKKSEVLNLPKSVSVPAIDLKPIGLYIPAKTYFLPTFTIPPSLDFNAPLFGLGEVSIKIHSNLYDWDGSISMGNKTVDIPSYVVKYKSIAQSPLSLLSYKLEGIGMLLGRADENLKYLLSTSFSHILFDSSFSAVETFRAKSSVEALEYTLEATTRLEAPRMKKLQFTETVKATHKTFSVDHKGYLTLTSSSAEVSATTVTKVTSQMYKADSFNSVALSLQSGINAVINTTYNHYLDIPSIKISNQASMKQNIKATMESGTITVVGQTSGDGKGSIQGYSDEGTHNSHVEFSVDLSTAKFLFAGETHCQTITTKHSVYAESVLFSHIIVEAKGETKCPVIKNSVFALNGEAHIGNLTASLTASHDTEFIGNLIGTMSNGVDFVIHPFEIVLDVKNKLNLKMFFPLKLSGKVDLHHHCGTVVASEKQGVYSIISARFNQYKYSHKFTAENTKLVVYIQSSVNGEANLDFMTLPFSIPRMSVPYFETKTPEITNFSLWEDTVLKSLLITPHQTFDINLKVQYNKNLETHSFELHLEPIYSAISDNAKIIQTQFEVCRDKVVTLLKDSYNEAKSQYIKHKIDTSGLPPRIFRVPGYTIPILNIQVSAFRAEMPAFSYFVPKEVSTPSFKIPALGFSVPSYTLVLPTLKFPVVHVPETLGEIKLPSLTLPSIQDNIAIPSFGNITLDFSLKSNMVTLSANAAISKQSDVVVQFEASSKSVFDILNGKIDATTSLTRKRGLKVASTVSLEHNNFEANHECALSLTKKSLEASVANSAKISFPFLQLEFNQELLGNTKTKPNVSSKKKLRYMFYIPLVESTGKGDFDMKWELDVLPSHMSFETSTQGKSDIAIMDMYNFDKDFENRASFYININGFSSTAATTLNVNINRKEKLKRSLSRNIFSLELDNNLVVGVSFIHVFAAAYYKSNNNVDLLFFSTNGNHTGKGELDIVPLATLKITINTDGDQFSNFGDIGFIHSMNLSCSPEKQTFTWSGKQQLTSLVHACDLSISNDESEQRLDLTGMVEGPLAFLKSVRLPVYQRTLWDVLKFDQVTNINTRQFLNYSSSIVYTKNEYGYEIPFKVFENGVTFSIPEISITLPSWMRNIPRSIKNEDMGSENLVVPDRFTLPPAVSLPAFDVPFTNLHVEQLTVDPKNFDVPKVISTKAFDIFLPGLPVISVPSYDINTEYVQRTTSFLSFKIPQYEITVSPGELTAGMNKITSHILDLEVPPIMIPEQKIKIPEVVLHLPTTVLVPVFGALSATLKVSSPIYNVSTTASVEMKDPNLVASLNSTCTSTMAFLEYGLTGTANLKYDNGQMFLSGICNLIHNDVNVNWQHVLAHKLRAKRQISRGDAVAQDSRHTLSVDVTSRTFADVSFRFASRKDGLTASASSPSAGFLGLNLQRRSPSQLHGKLFSRYLSSSDKDTNVFSAKVLLRNSDKLVLQTAWNLDFFNDATEGFKRKIPAMTDAVLKFINKYHTAHFGFDLNRGGMKLKNAISSLMETAFRKVLEFLTELQGLVEEVSEKGESLFRAASDSLMSIDVQEIRAKLIMMADEAMKNMQRRTKALLDAVRLFLSQQKFSLPGSETEMSVTEMFQRTHLYVSRAVDSGIQWLTSLMEKTSAYIKNTNVSLPATEVVVNGEEVMDKLTSIAVSAYNQIKDFSSKIMLFLSKTLNGVLQLLAKNTDQLLVYLKDEKSKISSQADVIHAEVLQTSRRHIQGAKRRTTEFKDLVKLRINQAYNSVNLENINSGAEMFVGSLQSNLSDAFGESVDVMKRFSQNTAPYFKVGNQRADVEIPLPFLWKSFHEWPVPMRL
ncbi:apolipoprotein B-100 isoform X3 [Oryzias latipes]